MIHYLDIIRSELSFAHQIFTSCDYGLLNLLYSESSSLGKAGLIGARVILSHPFVGLFGGFRGAIAGAEMANNLIVLACDKNSYSDLNGWQKTSVNITGFFLALIGLIAGTIYGIGTGIYNTICFITDLHKQYTNTVTAVVVNDYSPIGYNSNEIVHNAVTDV